MSDVTMLATGLGFPEGPVVCQDGSVVLTEIRHGRCTRVTPDGRTRVFSNTGGGPNGLVIGPDGAFYLCNNGGSRYVEGTSMRQGPHPDYTCGSIQRIDPHTGEHTTLYTAFNGNKLSAPNDLVFDGHGGFYFTDLGKRYARHRDHGGIYYALPDGSKIGSCPSSLRVIPAVPKPAQMLPATICVRGHGHDIHPRFLPARADRPGVGVPDALGAVAIGAYGSSPAATQAAEATPHTLQRAQPLAGSHS